MLTQERYQMILSALSRRHTATVSELALALDASESTIRRDLNALDEMGQLHKVHGGATAIDLPGFSTQEEDVVTKSTLNVEKKDQVAQYAATLVTDDDFVYLDAGTTTGKMIDHLTAAKATYVTNGVDHAVRLTRRGFRTFILGGQFKSSTEAIVGATALQNVQKYNFTKCFMGTNGIQLQAGLTTPDDQEAMLKSEVMARSYIPYILADSSKFGRVSSLTFAPLNRCCIITDRLPDPKYRDVAIIKEVSVK